MTLSKKAKGRVDGFVVEGHGAGGTMLRRGVVKNTGPKIAAI